MTQERLVQCVFYSHVWTVHLLKHADLGPLANAVLAELAIESHLAPVFREQQKTRYGLAGLLAFSDCLDKLGGNYTNVPAPLILAPNPGVTEVTMESAVALLGSVSGPYDKATLLVHIADAARFANAYQYVDEFRVLWDLADFPNASIAALGDVLARARCLEDGRWRGFHLCSHPLRPTGDLQERRQAFAEAFEQYPALAAA